MSISAAAHPALPSLQEEGQEAPQEEAAEAVSPAASQEPSAEDQESTKPLPTAGEESSTAPEAEEDSAGEALVPGDGTEPSEARPASALDAVAADRLLWLAGRPEFPATSASRSAERRAEEDAALAELDRLVVPENTAWLEHVTSRLEMGSDADALWCATARVVGDLGLYELADKLAFELSPGRPTVRRAAAKEGLRALYGRWFQTPEEVQAFFGQLEKGAGTRLLLAELEREEARSRDRLLSFLENAPEKAIEHLRDPDPRVRARVAPLVARSVAGQAVEALNGRYDALVERVENESDAGAFHAALEAALSLVENAPEADPRSSALRRLLLRRLEKVNVARAVSIARALPRVPWPATLEAQGDGLVDAVSVLGGALRRFSEGSEVVGGTDSDAIVVTLQSLRTLAERARGSELAAALRSTAAREPVVAIVRDRSQSDGVRTAAVAAFGPLASTADGPFFVDVLRDGDSPRVSYAVLGALRPILLEFEPAAAGALDVMREVSTLSGATDPDLRRRAFALLADPELERLARTLDPSFLVDRLETEPTREGLDAIFALLRRIGTPALSGRLRDLARFDELASGEEALARELASTLETLAGDDAARLLLAGRRLVQAPGAKTRLTRVLRALDMAAGLGADALAPLKAQDHLAIARWAYELHGAGVSLRDEIHEGSAFLAWLADISMPIVEELGADVFEAGSFAHLRAVARALSLGPEPDSALLQAIEADFAAALQAAEGDDAKAHPIHRDRARFYRKSGRAEKARGDYALLLGNALLDHSDLRGAAELFTQSEDYVRAFDFLDEMITGEPWRSEPPAVRMQDLEIWQAAARGAGAERRGRFVAAFEGLPAEVPQNGSDAAPGSVWAGLERDAERLARLQTLHAELAGESGVAPPPAKEDEGGDAPVTGGGEGAGEGAEDGTTGGTG